MNIYLWHLWNYFLGLRELILVAFICFSGKYIYNAASKAIHKYCFRSEGIFLLISVVLGILKNVCPLILAYIGSQVRLNDIWNKKLLGPYLEKTSGAVKYVLAFKNLKCVSIYVCI